MRSVPRKSGSSRKHNISGAVTDTALHVGRDLEDPQSSTRDRRRPLTDEDHRRPTKHGDDRRRQTTTDDDGRPTKSDGE